MRIAAALIATMLVGAAYAQTTPARESFISVAGEGHVNVAPDYAEFFVDVVTRGESLEAATRLHTDRAAKATAALRALAKYNVNVERSSFRLEQVRGAARPPEKKQASPEYRATTTFALKANQLSALNDVISAIAGAGVFEVRTVRYGINDEQRAIDDARREAVKNARRQAEVYADAAGVKLAEILEIFDGVAQNLGSEAALRAATPNVQVSPPATIPFRAGINIKWRIVAKP
ncbi:MAG: SIMPL domain-containing protein [Xanthobacteraceae bacterium]|nr:SIMPL domain-containing protein [Xanthobacteraceae bacterium]